MYNTFSSWQNSVEFTLHNSTAVRNLVSGNIKLLKSTLQLTTLQLKDDCCRESNYWFMSWWYHKFFGRFSSCIYETYMFWWGSTSPSWFSFKLRLKSLDTWLKFRHILLVLMNHSLFCCSWLTKISQQGITLLKCNQKTKSSPCKNLLSPITLHIVL